MTKFVRVEPKPVPENWRQEVKEYLDERQAFFDARAARSGSWDSPLNDVPTRLLPTHEEFLSYFETLLTMPDIAAAIERLWTRTEKDEGREPTYQEMVELYLILDFAPWWAYKYMNCNHDEHSWVSRDLEYVHEVVVSFLRGTTIQTAYAELKCKLVEQGRW